MSNSAVDSATAELRRLIARGRYQAGDRLPPERALADELGVSRPTLREATRRLTDAGVLAPRQGSGTYVAEIDLDNVFAVRLQLEPHAAALAAEHRSPEHLARLRALVRELAGAQDDPDAYAEADLAIHEVVAEAAGNPVLVDVLARLTELTRLTRAVTATDRAARASTLRDIRRLVRAIRQHDATAASQAMYDHLSAMRGTANAGPWRDRRPLPADRSRSRVRASPR